MLKPRDSYNATGSATGTTGDGEHLWRPLRRGRGDWNAGGNGIGRDARLSEANEDRHYWIANARGVHHNRGIGRDARLSEANKDRHYWIANARGVHHNRVSKGRLGWNVREYACASGVHYNRVNKGRLGT